MSAFLGSCKAIVLPGASEQTWRERPPRRVEGRGSAPSCRHTCVFWVSLEVGSLTMMRWLPRMPPTDHANRITSQWEGIWVGGLGGVCMHPNTFKTNLEYKWKGFLLAFPFWKEKHTLGKLPDHQPPLPLWNPFLLVLLTFSALSHHHVAQKWILNVLFNVKFPPKAWPGNGVWIFVLTFLGNSNGVYKLRRKAWLSDGKSRT